MSDAITSACPSCGSVATRIPYDIGSGPELCCSACEWCWGAEGQDLKPLDHDPCDECRLPWFVCAARRKDGGSCCPLCTHDDDPGPPVDDEGVLIETRTIPWDEVVAEDHADESYMQIYDKAAAGLAGAIPNDPDTNELGDLVANLLIESGAGTAEIGTSDNPAPEHDERSYEERLEAFRRGETVRFTHAETVDWRARNAASVPRPDDDGKP